MPTLADNAVDRCQATGVRFTDDTLWVTLSDGREVGLPLERIAWLSWLAKATPEQRTKWTIEPGGYAIHWDELDDGIEVCHLLTMQSMA
jgi:hypothetical protein